MSRMMTSFISSLLLSPKSLLSKIDHSTRISRLMSGGHIDAGSKANNKFPAVISASDAVDLFKTKKGVKFIDGFWHLGSERNATAEYLSKRIPGSGYFDIDKIRDSTNDLPHMLPTVKAFESVVGAMGINNDDHVVIYTHPGSFSAARVWYTFHTFGHEKVSVINGGIAAFVGAGGPIANHQPESPDTVQYKATFSSSYVVNAEEVSVVVSVSSQEQIDQ